MFYSGLGYKAEFVFNAICLMAAASVAVLECCMSCIESVVRIGVMVGTEMWKQINYLCRVSK